MTEAQVRELALALPGAEEKSHFGKADFRVRNKIFASLPDNATAVVKISPGQQEMVTAAEPAIFSAVKSGWGKQGWTRIDLTAADEPAIRSALTTAWRNVAPKSLQV